MNPNDLATLLQLWGKTAEGESYHPVLFHMLDVGNVARELLGPGAAPRFRNVLARVLGADDPDSLVDWLPLIVALHDIGKLSSPFQGMLHDAPRVKAQRARLEAAGFTFGKLRGERYAHQVVSADFIRRTWPALEPDLPPEFVSIVTDSIGGHHGTYVRANDMGHVRKYCEADEPEEWTEYRQAAYRVLRPLLAPAWVTHAEVPVPPHIRPATMALTGLIVLCDWLGSDEDRFGATTPCDIEEYNLRSKARAEAAVVAIGFDAYRVAPVDIPFAQLFPGIDAVRPLQTAIDDVPATSLSWPSLTVIEAPTGEGKTEAALSLARRLAVHGPSDEMYFALPTTATSNQMFLRVYSFLERVVGSGTSIKLVHGQAHLVEDDLLLRLLGDVDEETRTRTEAWFAPSKRALLAPFGVGTVDQVELTALNARYYMLRLFGLAGKVVIIDEVHAYDTYMSTVLERSLRWLSALGSSVILLSATLPYTRRAALAKAFVAGFGGDGDVQETLPPYPCVDSWSPHGHFRLTPPASQPDRELYVQFVRDDRAEQIAARCLELSREGGAVCYLCNTVIEAQNAFRALDAVAGREVQRLLVHSRFPIDERQNLEEQIVTLVGPSSSRDSRDRIVIIGTQVLEQSLDLDFDVMITDHAPIDLLLQRAGRLWRHRHRDQQRAPHHSKPVLFVRLPASADGTPSFGASGFVYDPYILWMSLLALQTRTEGNETILRLPVDYRPLIEETYAGAVARDHRFQEEIEIALKVYVDEERVREDEAKIRLSPDPTAAGAITAVAAFNVEEIDDDGNQRWGTAKTRLGEGGVTIIPIYLVHGRPHFDRHGEEPIETPCTRATQLHLLRRSIPLSSTPGRRSLVRELLQARSDPGLGWFRNAKLLTHAVPLVFTDGSADLAGYTLTLDQRLGLVLKKGVGL